jgi:DNA-binding MarR family transcriptional regulator
MEDPIPLPSHLRLAVLRLSRRLRQQTVGDISPSQLSALSSIAKHGEVSLGALATIERIAPPSMTRIAARLEEHGLVTRRVDAADRRVSRVVINQAGNDLLAATRTRRDAYLAARMHNFTDEEQAVLEQALPLLERLAADDPALEADAAALEADAPALEADAPALEADAPAPALDLTED